MLRKLISISINVALVSSLVTPLPKAQAQNLLGLPEPGAMVSLSQAYAPALIKGLIVHKDNPFLFDFIIDTGNSHLQGQGLKNESNRLIKYFFAALTIPEKDLWVNLSPYEKDRMIPQALGVTALGRDLLAQDYMLKQITASLIYPEKDLGKKFWDKVYSQAQEQFGTTQIPVNTFNKVWIVADKASVYEHNQTAFVVSGHLKVMLEEDYLATQKHGSLPGDMFESELQGTCPPAGCQASKPLNVKAPQGNTPSRNASSQIIREIIIPALEKEVNEGQNFATLRQIFYSQILATWFKRNLKQAVLSQVYANKSTVNGVNLSDPSIKDQIYKRYLEAYKKGAFNFIKDTDMPDGISVPRKYFSGGYFGVLPAFDYAQESVARQTLGAISNAAQATVLLEVNGAPDAAMADSKAYQGISFSVDAEGHLQGSVYNQEFVEWERGMRERYPKKKTIIFDANNTLVDLAESKNVRNPHGRSQFQYVVRLGIVRQIEELKEKGYRIILWTSGDSKEMLHADLLAHFDLIIDKRNIIPGGLPTKDLEMKLLQLAHFYDSLGYNPDQVETMKGIYRDNTAFKDISLFGSGNMLVDDEPHQRLINLHPFKRDFRVYSISRFKYGEYDFEDVDTLADRLDKMINLNAAMAANPKDLQAVAASTLKVINSGVDEDEFLKEDPITGEIYFTEEAVGIGEAQDVLLEKLIELGYVYIIYQPLAEPAGPQRYAINIPQYNGLREYLERVKVTGVLSDKAMGESSDRKAAVRVQHNLYFKDINTALALRSNVFINIVNFYDKNFDFINEEFPHHLAVIAEKVARLMQREKILGLEKKTDRSGEFTKMLKAVVERTDKNPIIIKDLVEGWTSFDINPKVQKAALIDLRDSITRSYETEEKVIDFRKAPYNVGYVFKAITEAYEKGIKGNKPAMAIPEEKKTKFEIAFDANDMAEEGANLYVEQFWTDLLLSINIQLNAAMKVQVSDQAHIDNGGIDLKSLGAGMTVTQDANGGVTVSVDPAMIMRVERDGIKRAEPVIIKMITLPSVLPLLGLNPTKLR